MIALAISAKFMFLTKYIFSGALVSDDTIFLSQFFFDANVGVPITQDLYYGVADFLSQFGYGAPKLLLLVIAIGIALLIFEILSHYSKNKPLIAVISTLLAVYPVSSDQAYFVTGAHPAAGVLVILLFLVLFQKLMIIGHKLTQKNFIIFTLLGSLILVAAFRTSPTLIAACLIMPISFLIVFIKDYLNNGFRKIQFWFIPASLTPLSITWPMFSGYHYSSHVGWTDYSIDRIFDNLGRGFEMIFLDPFERSQIAIIAVIIFTLTIVVAWIVLQYRSTSEDKKSWSEVVPVVALLVFISALTFGSGAITTGYLSRYAVAPFIFAGLAIAILVVSSIWSVEKDVDKSFAKNALTMGFAGLTATVLILSASLARSSVAPYIKSHSILKDAIAKYDWSDEEQIIVVLPNGVSNTTNGYNHWGTWYLRSITGNQNLIGLVGSEMQSATMNSDDLYVDKYVDHSPDFWVERNGKNARKTMIGLEKSRATYVFIPDGNGGLMEADLVLQGTAITKRVGKGSSYANAETVKRISICNLSETPMLFVNLSGVSEVEIANMSGQNLLGKQILSDKYSADGSSTRRITLPETVRQNFRISISLQAAPIENDKKLGPQYSENYPPMPLISPALAIYNQGGQYIIQARGEGNEKFIASVPTPTSPLDIEIRSCEAGSEKSVLSIDGVERMVLVGLDVSGTWQLGNGFLQRYWAGEFLKFEVSTIE